MRRIFLIVFLLTSMQLPAASMSEDLYDHAFFFFRQGKFTEALPLFEQAISLEPDNWQYLVEYSVCLRKLHRYQQSIIAGWKLIKLAGDRPKLLANQGNTYSVTRNWSPAFELYKQAEARTAQLKWAQQNFLNLGYLEWVAGYHAKAAATFEYVLKQNPGNALAYIDVGAAYSSMGNHRMAARKMKKGIKLLKKMPDNQTTSVKLSYAKSLYKRIKARKKIKPPSIIGSTFQYLPERFLKKPSPEELKKLAADRDVRRYYYVTRNSALSLETPEIWLETKRFNANEPFFTISYTFESKTDLFSVKMSIMTQKSEKKMKLRDAVTMMSESGIDKVPTGKISIEKTMVGDFECYYFVIKEKSTDSSDPKEFPVLLRGAFLVNRYLVTFSIYEHEEDQALEKFKVFQSVKYEKIK